MDSIASNIKDHQILSTLQDLKEKLTEEKVDLKKLSLECSCVSTMFMNKDKSIGKRDMLRISNKSDFDPAEVNFYKKLKNVQIKLKINHYEPLVKKIYLFPKLGLNQKFTAITGKSFGLGEEKEEKLLSPNGISVISLIESENKTTFSAIQKTIACIEKNKNLFLCPNNKNKVKEINNPNKNYTNDKSSTWNVNFFSLTMKRNEFSFSEFKDLVQEKKWDKYGDLYKHYYCEVSDSFVIAPLDMFDFDAEENEFFIVVDEDGVIRHLGKFYDYSLEEKIKELIAKKAINSKNNINDEAHLNGTSKDNKENLVLEKNKDVLKEPQNTDNSKLDNKKILAEKNPNEKLNLKEEKILTNLKDAQVSNKNKDLNSDEDKENKNYENISGVIPKINILPNFSEETDESPLNPNDHSLSHFTPYMNFKSNLSEITQIMNSNNTNNNVNNNLSNTQKPLSSLNPISSTLEIKKITSTNSTQNLNTINHIKTIDLTKETTSKNNIFEKLKSFVSSALPLNPLITNANFEAFQAEFQKAYKTPHSPLAVNYLFFCEMSKIFKHSVNLETLEIKKSEEENPQFEIKIECFPKELEFISTLMQKFFTKEEVEKYNFSLKPIPNFSLKIASTTSCYLCQVVLSSAELQYFCFECRINFCSKCVQDFKNNFSGFAALVHKEHYLLAYQNPNKKHCENIAKFKLGCSLFAMFKEENLRKEHNFGCDVCGNSYNHQERYICLTCRPGLLQSGGFTDICAKCFEKVHVQGQVSLLSNNTHKADHVYLHMVYSGVNYYNF